MPRNGGRRRFRPTIRATVAVVPAVALLIGLGVWQIQRMVWKEDLIERMRSRMDGPAVALPEPAERDPEVRFRRVELTGTYLHERAMHRVAQARDSARGFELIVPMQLSDGRTVLVNRGWLPYRYHREGRLPEDAVPEGRVTIEGVVSFGGWGGAAWLKPANRPEANEWIWMDLPRMARHARVPDAVTSIYLDAVTKTVPGRWPEPRTPRVDLPRNHAGYAATWFGLAIALTVIYVLFHLRREPEERPEA